jgi:ankyrin repeat protein
VQKISTLVALLSITFASSSVYAQNNIQSDVKDPMRIVIQKEVSASMVKRIVSAPDEETRLKGLDGLIQNYGPWVTLNNNDEIFRMYITSYLIQTGHDSEAAWLVQTGAAEPWMTYRFGDGVANDFILAASSGASKYIEAILEKSPERVNTPLVITLDGQKALPLAILASKDYENVEEYDNLLLLLLKSGANPHQKMDSGVSPMIIASSGNNSSFVSVTQSFLDGQLSTPKGMFSNTALTADEMLEMQAIADAWIEKPDDEKNSYDYDKLYNLWIKMIIKGYNLPADLMYSELKNREQFDINAKSIGGVSPLMAVSLSSSYGGNVEYGKLLIDRGADPTVLVDVNIGENDIIKVNLIQLALRNDSYKVVALYIVNNVNFSTLPDEPNALILTQAIEQKAYKSAAVIKEALREFIEKSGLAN